MDNAVGSTQSPDRRRWRKEDIRDLIAALLDSVERRQINWRRVARDREPPRKFCRSEPRPAPPPSWRRLVLSPEALMLLFLFGPVLWHVLDCCALARKASIPCHVTREAVSTVAYAVREAALAATALFAVAFLVVTGLCLRVLKAAPERDALRERIALCERRNDELAKRLAILEENRQS